MRRTERCASSLISRKYAVTSYNFPRFILAIPTNFPQHIDKHLQGGYSYLITNTYKVIIENRR